MAAARSWVMQGKKGRILFIDDDADTCEMVRLLLGQAGYEAISASSCAEGLEKAKSDRFDLVLLDWYFPDGTGIDLCKMIRAHDREIPIFFYTGMAFDSHIHKAMQAGAQGCFIKPVDVENLLQTLSLYSNSKNGIGKPNRLR
jgi:two-component system, OmpR family, copper resistance phosphate regulon response regulator CusR